MQIFYYPMKQVQVTGSEQTTTHIGTNCLDIGYAADPYVYAPADCKIVIANGLYGASGANGIVFVTKQAVITQDFQDIVTFRMAHGNDVDLKTLGLALKKEYKQGERIYKVGVKGTTAPHIHWEMARGTPIGTTGLKKVGNNYTLNTTGGGVHTYDAVYLKTGTTINRGPSTWPQYKYPWTYEPVLAQAKTYPVENYVVNTTDAVIRLRQYPTTAAGNIQIGTLPVNATIKVLEMSKEKFDNYIWLKVVAGVDVGYCAYMPTFMTLIDTTPVPIDPTIELKKELAIANATIAAKNVEIEMNEKVINSLKAEVLSYVVVAKPLYEKA